MNKKIPAKTPPITSIFLIDFNTLKKIITIPTAATINLKAVNCAGPIPLSIANPTAGKPPPQMIATTNNNPSAIFEFIDFSPFNCLSYSFMHI